jgi:hypothetical protein
MAVVLPEDRPIHPHDQTLVNRLIRTKPYCLKATRSQLVAPSPTSLPNATKDCTLSHRFKSAVMKATIQILPGLHAKALLGQCRKEKFARFILTDRCAAVCVNERSFSENTLP